MVLPETVTLPHREPRAFANGEDHARGDVLILVARLIDLGREVSLFAVVALEQFGDDDRVGEELTLELLLVHDLVELIGIDPGRALEREDDFLRALARAGCGTPRGARRSATSSI